MILNKYQIRVSVPKLNNIEYFEYLLTGFNNLKAQGALDGFEYNTHFLGRAFIDRLSRKILKRPFFAAVPNWSCQLFFLEISGKKIKLALDVSDRPWKYDAPLLERVDLYFKCQYPAHTEAGYFSLSPSVKIELPKSVLEHQKKIRPFILGRPLGRKLDFKENNRILAFYTESRKFKARAIKLLAYFGNCHDSDPYIDVNHPHIKRAETLLFLQGLNDPELKIIFSPPKQTEFIALMPQNYQDLPNIKYRISDDDYRNLCRSSFATLNIAGLGGSIPFRFIDAFLSGMLIVTDTLYVKWYVPLVNGKEIYDFGSMGYDVLSQQDWVQRFDHLKAIVNEIHATWLTHIDYQNNFFEKYLTPEAVARYVIDEAFKII